MKKGECYGGLYRALRPLGQGGQGSVFLAVHERSSRLMALKEIPLRGQTWDSLEKSHFCHFDHDGLPKIYDLFLENGNGYVVMEYVPGWNLREYRERKGPMPGSMLLDLSGELAEILVYLHGRTPPLIHGDIKPGNLIVRKDGKLVLVDFGAAFQKDGRRQKAYATQGFSAPELFLRDGRVDISSDLYSFGKTFQYLVGEKEADWGCAVFLPNVPRQIPEGVTALPEGCLEPSGFTRRECICTACFYACALPCSLGQARYVRGSRWFRSRRRIIRKQS